MENYILILKNDKQKSYRRMAMLILLLHLIYFNYYLLKVQSDFFVYIGIAVSLFALVTQFAVLTKNIKPLFPAWFSFLLLAAVWILSKNYWLSIALILLALLDYVSAKKIVLSFFINKIELYSFPKKIFLWNELNNVILKDRIITLDFKNDHLIQAEIDQESLGVDENLFNSFCKIHLQNIS